MLVHIFFQTHYKSFYFFNSFSFNCESTVHTTEEDFLLLFCIGSNAKGPEGKIFQELWIDEIKV